MIKKINDTIVAYCILLFFEHSQAIFLLSLINPTTKKTNANKAKGIRINSK